MMLLVTQLQKKVCRQLSLGLRLPHATNVTVSRQMLTVSPSLLSGCSQVLQSTQDKGPLHSVYYQCPKTG